MTSTGKALTAGGCVLVAILCFGTFAQKGFQREPNPIETLEPAIEYPDFPDCDKDDRSPNWEVADCGPSPVPTVRPVKTAFQPKPTPKPRTTRR